MRIGRFEFRPGLWPTLAVLLLLPVLCGLGVWQYQRAGAKRELLADYARRSQAAPLTVDGRAAFDETLRYRRVWVTGRYDAQHQFLLDNQVRDEAVGYHVFTPLRLDGGRAILVNRGWVAQAGLRNELPELPTPSGEVRLTGLLASPPGHGVLLGADIETDRRWPRVVQAIELPRLQRDLDVALVPQVLLLDPAAPGGFAREWQIVAFGPERHLGYAFQWFMLAVALLVIYIVVNTRRIDRVKRGES